VKWNGWVPQHTISAFSTPLFWSDRTSLQSIATNASTATGAIAARWSGQLYAASTGAYGFKLRSGDGSRLYLNKKLVIDNDGLGMAERSQTLQLSMGWQSITLVYFSSGGSADGGLEVSIKKPGSPVFVALPAADTIPSEPSPSMGFGTVDRCSCGTNLDTVFVAPAGQSILSASSFRSMCECY
jgi:hypothetical protein